MAQRAVPSAPLLDGTYVISGFREAPGRNVIVEVVTDRLQRLYVNMPRARTSTVEIDLTIRHAIAALARPPDPVR
jgi:hypothetical protein